MEHRFRDLLMLLAGDQVSLRLRGDAALLEGRRQHAKSNRLAAQPNVDLRFAVLLWLGKFWSPNRFAEASAPLVVSAPYVVR